MPDCRTCESARADEADHPVREALDQPLRRPALVQAQRRRELGQARRDAAAQLLEVARQLVGELGRLRGQRRQHQHDHHHQEHEQAERDRDGRRGTAEMQALQPVGRRVEQIGGRHADHERQEDAVQQDQTQQQDRQRQRPEERQPHAMAQEARSRPSARSPWAA